MVWRFIKDFWLGLYSYYKAFVVIIQYNLWLFFLVPIALSIALYFSANVVKEELIGINLSEALSAIDFEKEFSEIKFQGVSADSGELLILGAKLIFVIIAFKFNKYLVLLLLTPMNAMISARIERLLTGNRYKFNFNQYVEDIYRGVNFVLRNLARQAFIYLLWYLLVFMFPFLDMFSFYIIFLVGAFYYGASLMDYTNERRRLSMEESVQFIRQNAGMAMAIGGVFYSLFFVSIIGIILAPVLGVAAATLAIHNKIDLGKKKRAN